MLLGIYETLQKLDLIQLLEGLAAQSNLEFVASFIFGVVLCNLQPLFATPEKYFIVDKCMKAPGLTIVDSGKLIFAFL